MKLYRVFPYDKSQRVFKNKGGPLFVPVDYQGGSRHDIAGVGLLYCTLEPVAAVSERLQSFKQSTLGNDDFNRGSKEVLAMTSYELAGANIIDLRDARQVIKIKTTISDMATRNRDVTQKLAKDIYEKGLDGILWCSTIEAKWTNASLFLSRIRGKIKVAGGIEVLDVNHTVVVEAAEILNIRLRRA